MGQFYLIYGNDEQAVKKKASAVAGKFTADNDGLCDIDSRRHQAPVGGRAASPGCGDPGRHAAAEAPAQAHCRHGL